MKHIAQGRTLTATVNTNRHFYVQLWTKNNSMRAVATVHVKNVESIN